MKYKLITLNNKMSLKSDVRKDPMEIKLEGNMLLEQFMLSGLGDCIDDTTPFYFLNLG